MSDYGAYKYIIDYQYYCYPVKEHKHLFQCLCVYMLYRLPGLTFAVIFYLQAKITCVPGSRSFWSEQNHKIANAPLFDSEQCDGPFDNQI